jgi:7,8-dihydroneopterin aldolase/epimerase/oxygenase
MSNYVIALTGLRVRGYHGVLAHEREEGQEFVVDLELRTDTRAAATSDALADTIDYGAVAQAVAAVVAGEPVDLIETLAQRIADVVLIDPRVESVTVVLHKPKAPIPLTFDDVSLRIERSRA